MQTAEVVNACQKWCPPSACPVSQIDTNTTAEYWQLPCWQYYLLGGHVQYLFKPLTLECDPTSVSERSFHQQFLHYRRCCSWYITRFYSLYYSCFSG